MCCLGVSLWVNALVLGPLAELTSLSSEGEFGAGAPAPPGLVVLDLEGCGDGLEFEGGLVGLLRCRGRPDPIDDAEIFSRLRWWLRTSLRGYSFLDLLGHTLLLT